jgi:diaminopimelate epimerase
VSERRSIPFTKMHGAGNDFVLFDGIREQLPPIEPLAAKICDRHYGIGCDQLLIVLPSRAADFRMEIYNADGTQVEMCGNGLRAFYKFLRSRGYTSADEISVETLGGIVRPRWVDGNRVRVDMGQPVLAPAKIPTTLGSGDGPVLDVPIEIDGESLRVSCVSMGNPHAVVVVADPKAVPLERIGPQIERHAAFPNGTNVEFITPTSRSHIVQRTWERGVGETLACGSGACAVAVVSILRDLVDRSVTVELPGGELEILWGDAESSVIMTGPAAETYCGEFPVERE